MPDTSFVKRHSDAARVLPQAKLWVDGKSSEHGAEGIFEHVNPSTGQVQATVPMAGRAEVDAAVAAARKAFPMWRDTSPTTRREILERLAGLILKNADDLARTAILENGSTFGFASQMAGICATWTSYYAGWADKIDGLVAPTAPNDQLIFTTPEPYGVAAIIITWNSPLMSLGMKIAPALAAGNTVVLKPAELTPFTSTRFVELANEAGVPPGVLNLIIGGAEAGSALVEHQGIDKISFTGGPETAKRIMISAAKTLRPLLFELGGKSANIIFDDANLAEAIPFAATFGLYHAGQGCALPTRILVQAGVYDAVVSGLLETASSFSLGDPLDPGTYMGPVVNSIARDRIMGVIDRAQAERSGRLALGGARGEGECAAGFFIKPTIFVDVDPTSSLAQHEIFGPVLSVIKFGSEEEAITIANSTEYALSAYIQSTDFRRVRRVARQLRCGTIGVNTGTCTSNLAPFGGLGLSGFGKEGGKAGIDEFVHQKTLLIR